MKRSHLFLSVCCLSVIAAGAAIGQPGDAKPGTRPGAKPAMPAMTPEQMKEMQAMQEAATPGPMHEWLVKGCGIWDGKVKMWETPDATASESTCTTSISSMMEGRFTKVECKGLMKMGEMSMPFEGFGIYGYNNTTQQFESTWCDSMGTMQMHSTGKLSDDKKTLTLQSGKFTCPMTHQEMTMREVQTMTGPDTMTLEMYGPDMSGKVAEYKVMEIKYTRKSGTAPKAGAPMKDMKPTIAPKAGN